MTSSVGTDGRVIVGYGQSDRGLVRENNEDNFICDNGLRLYAVIDGMGGKAAGEVAAGIARDIILKRMGRQTGTPVERVREAITLANNAIFEQGIRNEEWKGMGCVLTIALLESDKLTIGHVGDTRLYLLSKGKAIKITPDHSPIGLLEDGGLLAEIEAMRHPRRNEVSRDVGGEFHSPEDPAFIEIIERTIAPGESIILCTDGLTDAVTREEIALIESTYSANPPAMVEALIRAANDAGGRDNVTVVYIPNWQAVVPMIERYRFSVFELSTVSMLVAIVSILLTAFAMWYVLK
jgi:serine/threonine protein phosphatase PrpC